MSVSGIQSWFNVAYQTVYQQKSSRNYQESYFNSTRKSDTVHISEEAKALSQNSQAEKNVQASSANGRTDEDLPLEAYSLPKWYADWVSDYMYVDDEIGISYSDSRLARYDALSPKEKKDLAEYHDTLHKYFQEELANNGVKTSADYYESIILDQKNSEDVHQAMKQRLSEDPRMMELMQYFGISL